MSRSCRFHGCLAATVFFCAVAAPRAVVGTPVSWFTDQTAFESQLQAGFFDSFAPAVGEQASPQTFSGGGWSFRATAEGGLYGLSGVIGGESGLQPLNFSTPLVLSMISPGATAFGGTFSLRDEFEAFTAGTLGLSIFNASNEVISGTSLAVSGSAGVFRGLIIYSATTPISRVEFTTLTTPLTALPTVQGVVVAAASPPAGPITIDVASGTQTQGQAGYPLLSGTTPVEKIGAGAVVFDQANTLTGPTSVTQGTLELATADTLSSSAVTVVAGATLSVAPQVSATVPVLVNNGLVNVGLGGLTVTSGQTAEGIVAAIIAGRADGSWSGTSGITSSAAATQSERAVGWLNNGDGSFTVSFAAAGDWNVNGVVDFDDVVASVSANLYDTGLPATWADGDYDYNGVVDFDDVVASVSANLFDAGPYNQPVGGTSLMGFGVDDDPGLMSGGFAAVPEPATSALALVGLAMTAWAVRMNGRRRGGPSAWTPPPSARP